MIDLHMHTVHSDGTDSVETLLKKAEKNKLEVLSITDHNSAGAYFELENNPTIRNNCSGDIIIGSEIKCIYENVNIEVLAYGFDYRNLKIKQENIQKVQGDILNHFVNVGKRLGLKVDDDLEIDINESSKMYAGWVFCDNIFKYKENEELIQKYAPIDRISFYREHEGNKNSPFYYDTSIYYDDCQTLIDKIHNAGGLAFLAHGLIYPFNDKKATIEKIVKTTDIDGLECIYPLFSKDDMIFMKSLCRKYNKFIQ